MKTAAPHVLARGMIGNMTAKRSSRSKMSERQDTPRPSVVPQYHAVPPEVNVARLIADSDDSPRIDR